MSTEYPRVETLATPPVSFWTIFARGCSQHALLAVICTNIYLSCSTWIDWYDRSASTRPPNKCIPLVSYMMAENEKWKHKRNVSWNRCASSHRWALKHHKSHANGNAISWILELIGLHKRHQYKQHAHQVMNSYSFAMENNLAKFRWKKNYPTFQNSYWITKWIEKKLTLI